MTVTVDVQVLKRLEEEIDRLHREVQRMLQDVEGFEPTELDALLTEAYN